jgi:predicted RNA-binding protein with PUA-like domain
MAYWLLKTEPETFSWDDQVKRGAKGEPWTGVRNFIARRNLEVIRESYRDPTDEKGVFLAVDVKALKPFAKPVTLATVKADARLKAMSLAKHPRLSVQPVTPQEWKIVCALGGVKD